MILSALILSVIGIIAAALLYVVARRFHVEADPRIDEVESLLPGANCGGCGFSGCRAFAQACCKAASLNGLSCPGSDATVMEKIAGILGQRVAEADDRRNVELLVSCGRILPGMKARRHVPLSRRSAPALRFAATVALAWPTV